LNNPAESGDLPKGQKKPDDFDDLMTKNLSKYYSILYLKVK